MALRAPMQPLPCKPPPGLNQFTHCADSSASVAKTRRPRENASQNRNCNSAWKDHNRAPTAGFEKAELDGDDASRRVFQPYHSMSVPKKRDLEMSYGCNTAMTTVMLRNIPNKYTQGSLLQEIDCMGFAATYNFFYLPMDIHNRTNVGYAFINFMSPSDMQAFVDAFTEYKFKRHQSQKIARVSPAHIQGFLENVCHFSSCAVTRSRNSQYRPVVVHYGQLRDLSEILLELSVSTASPLHHTAAERMLAPEVLSSLANGAVGWTQPRGLNPAAAEFVPMPYASSEAAWSATTANSSFDPSAEEFIPQAAAAQLIIGTPPQASEKFSFQTQHGDTSFTMAKKGLEEAVSMWLTAAKPTDSQSTEGGDSGAGSSHESPRSSSDKDLSPVRDALGVSGTILGNATVSAIIEAH